MKVNILHNCHHLHPYSGNIFYQFEYYIYLLKKGVDVGLVFTPSCDVPRILEIMRDRYNLDDIDYMSGISTDGVITAPNVITTTKVVYDLNGNIDAENLYVVDTWASYYYMDDINRMLSGKNVKRYNESKICGDTNYIRPIYFDILKKPSVCDDAIYLHIAGKARHIFVGDFIRHISDIIRDRNVVVSYTKEQEHQLYFLNQPNITRYIDHVPNLFEKYNTYMYVLLRGFDFSPRMMVESHYLGKDIIYIDGTQHRSAYGRYQDCMNDDIEKYRMTDNDILIGNFI